MTMRIRILGMILCLCSALTLHSGCGGGGGGGLASYGTDPAQATPETPAASDPGTYSIQGRVADEQDNAVPYATVTLNNGELTTQTNSKGVFWFNITTAPGPETRIRLGAEKAAYVPADKRFPLMPDAHKDGVFEFALCLRREPDTAEQATRAMTILADGSQSVTPPQGVVNDATGLVSMRTTVSLTGNERAVIFSLPEGADGQVPVTLTIGAPDGSGAGAAAVLNGATAVTGSLTYGDPTKDADLKLFPGDFTTNSDTGTGAGSGALITAGFARLALTDENGNAISTFADGAEVSVTMRVPSGFPNPETGSVVVAGDTIPLFTFQESTGDWVVEHNADGSVKRVTVQQDSEGLFVSFTTSHLSWWNLDFKTATCGYGNPVIKIVDAAGNPVRGAYVGLVTQGWYVDYRYAEDSTLRFIGLPSQIDFHVAAMKDAQYSNVATINQCRDSATGLNEVTLTLNQTCNIRCSQDTDCDDQDPATVDSCYNPGTCVAFCQSYNNTPVVCSTKCSQDSDCDDQDPATADSCIKSGFCDSVCCNKVPKCTTETDCDDQDAATVDVCLNGGTCSAACTNFSIKCTSDAACDDLNPDTTDSCNNPNTAYAYCDHFQPECLTDTDCNDSDPVTTDTCENPGQRYAKCYSYTILCNADADCAPATPVPGQRDYCREPGTRNAECVSCQPACYSSTDCNDYNPATVDLCRNAGACEASCSNCKSVCTADAQCDDTDPATLDTCNNPGTCFASCSHGTVKCYSDADCADGDPATTDTCRYPGLAYSYCVNPCNVACTLDTDCDDSNPATVDACTNPGMCSSSCVSQACSVACSTDAGCTAALGQPAFCIDPGQCSASCSLQAAGHWENVGSDPGVGQSISMSSEESMVTSALVKSANDVYVAWSEGPSWYYMNIKVSHWDGAAWTDMTANLNPLSSIFKFYGYNNTSASLALDSSGLPIAAWLHANRVFVKRWTGAAWVEMGANSATGYGLSQEWSSTSEKVSLCSGTTGNPVVAWVEGAGGVGMVYVKQWNGSAWSLIAAIPITNGSLGNGVIPSLACSGPSAVYLMLDNMDRYSPTTFPPISVRRWDGSAWTDLGAVFPGGLTFPYMYSYGTRRARMSLDSAGNPVVAWNDLIYSNSAQIFMKKWNGSAWVEFSPGSASGRGVTDYNGFAGLACLLLNQQDHAYLMWYDLTIDSGMSLLAPGISMKEWNGSKWVAIGDNAPPATGIELIGNKLISSGLGMSLSDTGTPYVFWSFRETPANTVNIYARKWIPGN